MMRPLNLFFCGIIFICIPALAEDNSATRMANPQADSGTLTSMYYPLLDRLGNMSICNVPVIVYGSGPGNLIESLQIPIFPASEKKEDGAKDANLIALAGIGVRAKKVDNGTCTVLIDVTWAQKPPTAKADIADIVEAITACLRLRFQQGIVEDINIKIVGAPSNDPVWKKLEGPLWHSY